MAVVRTNIMRLAIFVLGSSLVACAGNEGNGDDDEAVNCALETRDDEFAAGMQKTGNGGTLDFSLMSATPAPPVRGDNAWIMQVHAGDTPIDGADMTVSPFMPDHGHPAAKTVIIEPTGNAGEYELNPINLWMPGLWEVTIDAKSAGGDDVVVFRFCIPS